MKIGKLQQYLNEKTIFLFDGGGAVVSAVLHSVALPVFTVYIGLPVEAHYVLAAFPLIYLCYSLFCYFNIDHKNPKWLKIVIFANIFYCFVTAIMLVSFWGSLKALGVIYFLAEFLAIFFVVYVEKSVLATIK